MRGERFAAGTTSAAVPHTVTVRAARPYGWGCTCGALGRAFWLTPPDALAAAGSHLADVSALADVVVTHAGPPHR